MVDGVYNLFADLGIDILEGDSAPADSVVELKPEKTPVPGSTSR